MVTSHPLVQRGQSVSAQDPTDDEFWQKLSQTVKRLAVKNPVYRESKSITHRTTIRQTRYDNRQAGSFSKKLDLHGYTRQQAYQAVTSFIGMAYRLQWRSVEIVTGRGQQEQGTGVLRREVPLWLEQSPLSTYIRQISLSPKSREGSLIVMLHRDKT